MSVQLTYLGAALAPLGIDVYNAKGGRVFKKWRWIVRGPIIHTTSSLGWDTPVQAAHAAAKLYGVDTWMALDAFTRHYLIAAIWADAPDGSHVTRDDLHPTAIQQAWEDCQRFQRQNADLLNSAYIQYDEKGMSYHPDAGSAQACAGHDFWLTRNHHGAGFWDRGLDTGEALTSAAHDTGAVSLSVQRGKIYLERG